MIWALLGQNRKRKDEYGHGCFGRGLFTGQSGTNQSIREGVETGQGTARVGEQAEGVNTLYHNTHGTYAFQSMA